MRFNNNKQKISLILILYSLLLIASFGAVELFLFSNKVSQTTLEKAKEKSLERETFFKKHLMDVNRKLIAISEDKTFKEFILHGKSEKVEELFLTMAKSSPEIMQLRYIDKEGMEIIRIDQKGLSSGKYEVVDTLQNKSKRDYFKIGSQQPPNKVWFSAVDLNIEYGKVEVPFNPTLRAVFPLEKGGRFEGMIIINLCMEPFLNDFMNMPTYQGMLIDSKGDILIHSNNRYNWSAYQAEPFTLENVIDPATAALIIKGEEFKNDRYYGRKLNLPTNNTLYLVLENNPQTLNAKIRHHINIIVTAAVVTIVLTWVLSIVIGRILDNILVQTQRLKSLFFASMSHELRTPLNGVSGLIDLALKHTNEKIVSEYLSKARDSSKILLHIINDILEFSKNEEGKFVLNHKVFALKPLIEDIKNMFKNDFVSRSLEFRIEIDPDIPNKMVGDPIRLTQILNNLVGNGLKYSDEGTITLRLKLRESNARSITVEFSISDTGIGMDRRTLGEIFTPFYQSNSFRSDRYGGTGLGLVITKQLVEMMGGEIRVESTPLKGSTFYVTLRFDHPTYQESEETLNRSLKREEKLRFHANALIVDDNDVNLFVLRKKLEEYGIRVETAKNGVEAIEKALSESFDIIFMDIHMPELGGFDAAKQIRNSLPTMPIIAFSATEVNDREIHSGDGVINHSVLKPLDPFEIEEILLHYLFERIDTRDTDGKGTLAEYIDMVSLEQLFEDQEMIGELLRIFAKNHADFCNKIESTEIGSDLFHTFMHSFEGALKSIHASTIVRLIGDIESARDEMQIRSILSEVCSELKRLLLEIEKNFPTKL
jgi:signal transduction histidine kinase/CheY-like chemotaxis protein